MTPILLALLLLPGAPAFSSESAVSACLEAGSDSVHRYRPGCREIVARGEAEAEMSFNSLGLRDKDYAPSPKPGWKRILFVGSSRTLGPGLKEKDSPPRQLEAFLRASKHKVEVINASVEGYSPVHQATRLAGWIAAYHPTHVLLHLELPSAVTSDLLHAPYLRKQEGSAPRLEARVLPWMKPFALFAGAGEGDGLRRVYAWQSGLYRLWRHTRCKLGSENPNELTDCLAEPMLAAVHAMKEAAEASGAEFVASFEAGPFRKSLNLSPIFDAQVIRRLEGFTPAVLLRGPDLFAALSRQQVNTMVLAPLRGDEYKLSGVFNYNASGAALFARTLSVRMAAVLEKQPGAFGGGVRGSPGVGP